MISSTKLKKSNTSENPLSLYDPLEALVKSRKKTKTIEKLNGANINTINDLLWCFPLRAIPTPPLQDFSALIEDELFKGEGIIQGVRITPAFQKGKGRAPLANISANVKDLHSNKTLILQWFNAYPNLKNKIQGMQGESICFMGKPGTYRNQFQIVSPDLLDEDLKHHQYFIVQYPTINGLAPQFVKKIVDLIPDEIFENYHEYLSDKELYEKNFSSLPNAFRIMHGKGIKPTEYSKDAKKAARRRLAFEEFLNEQLRFQIRKSEREREQAPVFETNYLERYKKLFPFELTEDQNNVINDIQNDLKAGTPMARLIQGDVGSGKTAVALISSLIVAEGGAQVALMCPTEALASQHFHTFNEILSEKNIEVGLLLGSLKSKEKNEVNVKLQSGEIDIVIGTHALFQKSVKFKNLGLAIIDEQHKFGVNQRLKLVEKGEGCHSLLLTATPIPRSLSLTQFGDLDISVIKSMPAFRKEIKTRIVEPGNFEKFLSFMNTRISMGEQAYLVVPAIEENPEMDIAALDKVTKRFKGFFPNFSIDSLHGQLPGEEKLSIFHRFLRQETQLLISTSVIEVGINNPNATVMAILNPERFGLSSIHQLRGRVGRGDKPGFCFLIVDKTSLVNIPRLKVIEQTQDGFKIAEADLEIRGQGDLFGTSQSGGVIRKIANIIEDQDILFQVKEALPKLLSNQIIKDKQILIEKEKYVLNTV